MTLKKDKFSLGEDLPFDPRRIVYSKEVTSDTYVIVWDD